MKSSLKFFLTCTFILIFIATTTAQPPAWAWAQSAGGISSEYSNAICTDAYGNVYATGTFQGTFLITRTPAYPLPQPGDGYIRNKKSSGR